MWLLAFCAIVITIAVVDSKASAQIYVKRIVRAFLFLAWMIACLVFVCLLPDDVWTPEIGRAILFLGFFFGILVIAIIVIRENQTT